MGVGDTNVYNRLTYLKQRIYIIGVLTAPGILKGTPWVQLSSFMTTILLHPRL